MVTSELLNYLKGQVTSGQTTEVIKNNLSKLINKINSCVLKIEVQYEES